MFVQNGVLTFIGLSHICFTTYVTAPAVDQWVFLSKYFFLFFLLVYTPQLLLQSTYGWLHAVCIQVGHYFII